MAGERYATYLLGTSIRQFTCVHLAHLRPVFYSRPGDGRSSLDFGFGFADLFGTTCIFASSLLFYIFRRSQSNGSRIPRGASSFCAEQACERTDLDSDPLSWLLKAGEGLFSILNNRHGRYQNSNTPLLVSLLVLRHGLNKGVV